LFFGTAEQIEHLRPLSEPINRFQFGNQTISTRVCVMMPRQLSRVQPLLDVTAAMADAPARDTRLKVVPDPFEEVDV
jgi:hypothetical protein